MLVLDKLQQEKLLINLKKCSFVRTQLIYLGFVIFGKGSKMDQEKEKSIINWPNPKNVFEVRSFHGLEIFYRKFIRNFSGMCAPIIETNKGTKQSFNWTEAINTSFKLLKKKIPEQPILALHDFNKLFQVECDASGIKIGAFLSQEKKLFAYFSEKLNEAKKNYSLYDNDFYAIIQASKKWRHYLMPKEFVIYTDNHALQYINSQTKFNQRHVK